MSEADSVEVDMLRISCRDLSGQVYALRDDLAAASAALAISVDARNTLRDRLTATEAERDEARALLRECLDAVRMTEDYYRPLGWDDTLRARIAALLGGGQ